MKMSIQESLLYITKETTDHMPVLTLLLKSVFLCTLQNLPSNPATDYKYFNKTIY